MIVLYVHNITIAEAIHPYLINRCRTSVYTSLHIVWLLNAFCPETSNNSRKNKSLGNKLRNLILSEELKLQSPPTHSHHKTHYRSFSDATTNSINSHQSINCVHSKTINQLQIPFPNSNKSLNRSLLNSFQPSTLGDLSSGQAFDNGCRCYLENLNTCSICLPSISSKINSSECHCDTLRIKPQYEFIRSIMNIGMSFNQNVNLSITLLLLFRP